MATTDTVTVLFTSFGGKGELLARPDMMSRQIHLFEILVADAVATCGGRESQWLGDGMMAVFRSASDAVRCATIVQQTGRRASAGGPVRVRVGLHVGETPSGKSASYGIPLPVARGLCEHATAGQILCSKLIAGLLSERRDFDFRDLPDIELQQGASAIAVCEVTHTRDDPAILLHHPPFVGRSAELSILQNALAKARTGQGGLVMLVGEPGIGKTRMVKEFTEVARGEEALVLWGRCYEGEWAPPFGPFAEALAEHIKVAEPEQLRRDLGFGAPPLSRLVPAIRIQLPDLTEPETLQPDEERFRLLDAVSQFLIAVSTRQPVVLVLDDLHWADKGTIAMLRHLARFLARSQILTVGAYRDVELDREHPLAESLGVLRRESNYVRIVLKGLGSAEIAQLLEAIAERDVPERLVNAIAAETAGNPFFIREVLLHLVEEGKIFRKDGRWTTELAIEAVGIPEGVRQVIGRRLSRLSAEANRLLSAASFFNGTFQFHLAATGAGLDDEAALSALDEALGAQLIRSAFEGDTYDFTHALIRHTLYAEQNPSRQVRMHRQVADAMESLWGNRSKEHAAELAYQFARSAALPGADRGAEYAIAAADHAEAAYAHDEVVTFLRLALVLLSPDDPRRTRLLGRVGLALARVASLDEAVKVAQEAGRLIARSESDHASAEYFAEVTEALNLSGGELYAWTLVKDGLAYAGHRRDFAWVMLTALDLAREDAERLENPGIPLPSPRRKEMFRVWEKLSPAEQRKFGWLPKQIGSRDQILAEFADRPDWLTLWAGEFRSAIPLWQASAVDSERSGRLALAVAAYAHVARCHIALGDFEAARGPFKKARALAERLPAESSMGRIQLLAARDELQIATDEGWREALPVVTKMVSQPVAENGGVLASIRASGARIAACAGQVEQAVALLGTVIAPLELTPVGYSDSYVRTTCDVASTLWMLNRIPHIEVVERNIREKVLKPDFRCPMYDGRLSLARLCALQSRHDEAMEWFAKARVVLEEQGARPLRAIADFDEALMFARRMADGDKARARHLLEVAIAQFQSIGMTGWVRRAEALLHQLDTVAPSLSVGSNHTRADADAGKVFRREGDIRTTTHEGQTLHPRDVRGLSYSGESQRIVATLLFIDIVSSTEHVTKLRDRRWVEIRSSFFEEIRKQLANFNGREIDAAGDGMLAIFDHPAAAIKCAFAMSQGVEKLGLQMRAGVHTGECELIGGDAIGIAVHIGARVAAQAGPDEVMVSSTVRDLLVGGEITFVDRGVSALKGIPGEWRLYAVERHG